MPAVQRPQNDARVLLVAPTLRDGAASRAVLGSASIACEVCSDLPQLCREAPLGAAALIIPEELVLADAADRLSHTLSRQPVWSDLPVILLSHGGAESPVVERALKTLGNVSLIERPVRVTTLLSVVRAALRARERQYEIRDHLVQREQSERAVREARDAAEAASRAKDQFLAVLSHELRTPLSPVLMSIGSMQVDPKMPEVFRDDLSMIRRNVELEVKLIDDLLDVSRVISGKLRLRSETVSVHELLRHAIEVCASDSQAKLLAVEFDLRAANDRVVGDPARLEQVFWNLVKNAVKFTPRGRTISLLTSNPSSEKVRIEVRDTGVGIAPEVLPIVFNAFEQGSPAVTRQFGGMGLGLAISRAVIELHGGTIHAESDGAGKGATFIIELSATHVPPIDGEATLKSDGTDGGSPAHDRRTLRVLLVEDHADTARVIGRLLSAAGHNVRTAATVGSALKLAACETFDILVSDLGLPDATGFELMQEIRQRYAIKGIALSGYGTDNDLQRGRLAGFAEHLIKPITPEQLEAVIQRVAAGT